MNTAIIAISLFSLQSPASSSDLLSFNIDEVKQQVRSYLTEDVNAVSKMVQDAIRDGIAAGTEFFALEQQADSQLTTAGAAQADHAARTATIANAKQAGQ